MNSGRFGGEARDPQPLGPSLDRVAKSLGVPRASVLTTVFQRWEELVGADLAAHCRPISLSRGTLAVVTDHPGWATQLRFLEGEILRNLLVNGTPVAERIAVRVSRNSAKP